MDETLPEAMRHALYEARKAALCSEIPVGAVITNAQGVLIARAGNRVRTRRDATAHAEILALRLASKALGNERLSECDMWVTLEPCPMCAHAIALARIRRLYYGASDPKSGGVEQCRIFIHHRPEIYAGIARNASQTLLQDFFRALRARQKTNPNQKSMQRPLRSQSP